MRVGVSRLKRVIWSAPIETPGIGDAAARIAHVETISRKTWWEMSSKNKYSGPYILHGIYGSFRSIAPLLCRSLADIYLIIDGASWWCVSSHHHISICLIMNDMIIPNDGKTLCKEVLPFYVGLAFGTYRIMVTDSYRDVFLPSADSLKRNPRLALYLLLSCSRKEPIIVPFSFLWQRPSRNKCIHRAFQKRLLSIIIVWWWASGVSCDCMTLMNEFEIEIDLGPKEKGAHVLQKVASLGCDAYCH